MKLYGITVVDPTEQTCYLLFSDVDMALSVFKGQVADALKIQEDLPGSCGPMIYDIIMDGFRPVDNDDAEDCFFGCKPMLIGGTISLRAWFFDVEPDPETGKVYTLEIYHRFGGTDELFVFENRAERDEKVLAYCQGFQYNGDHMIDNIGGSVQEALSHEELPGKIHADTGIEAIEIVVGTYTI